jgi:hypothetical protein
VVYREDNTMTTWAKRVERAAIAAAVGAVAVVVAGVATGTDPLGVLGALRGIWGGIQSWVAVVVADQGLAVVIAVLVMAVVFVVWEPYQIWAVLRRPADWLAERISRRSR